MITAEGVVSAALTLSAECLSVMSCHVMSDSHNANYGTTTMGYEHEKLSEALGKSRAQGSGERQRSMTPAKKCETALSGRAGPPFLKGSLHMALGAATANPYCA